VERVAILILQKLDAMVQAANPDSIMFKRKTITAILPFAISLEQGGRKEMLDAVLRVAGASGSWRFIWRRVGPHIATLFRESNHPSLDRVITLISPHVHWDDGLHGQTTVTRWAAAALAASSTEEVDQTVVDATLQIASFYLLRPHLPAGIWTLLKNQPPLPPVCRGRSRGAALDIVRHVRGLGDLEILKSYLLLVWSEWDPLFYSGLEEMKISVRADFGGIGMWCDRGDLVRRLDHVLGQLDRGLGWLRRYKPSLYEFEVQRSKQQYGELRGVLLEVESGAANVLARQSPGFTRFCEALISVNFGLQIPDRPSLALYLFLAHDTISETVGTTPQSIPFAISLHTPLLFKQSYPRFNIFYPSFLCRK
jgi:hypothetical protein